MAGRIITITSGKGGVGKSTVTGNLSVALARQNKRVACIDLDIGLRNLDLVLGLENRVVYDLMDVVEGRVRWKQALVTHKLEKRLSLLPASQWRQKSALRATEIVRLCKDMISDFDFIIIDCPAGVEEGFYNAIAPADEIIIVATPEVSPVRDAARVIDRLNEVKKFKQSLILNRVRPALVSRGDMLSVSDCIELLNLELLGVILEDSSVISNTNKGMPVAMVKHSKAGDEFNRIARRLLGENLPLEAGIAPKWLNPLPTILSRL